MPSTRVEWSKIKSQRRRSLRAKLVERDGPKCFHCGRVTREYENVAGDRARLDQQTVDHYPLPKSCLRKSEWLNPERCVISCWGCNQGLNRLAQTGSGVKKVRCASCCGIGRESWAGTGPWKDKTSRKCSTCRGKGWHKPGEELGCLG